MKLCHCYALLSAIGRTSPKPTFLGTIQAEHWAEFPAHLQPAALGVGFAAAAACAVCGGLGHYGRSLSVQIAQGLNHKLFMNLDS